MDDSLSKTESDVFPDICCRLLLIGKTGCGKSSTGNTILGKDVFQAKTGINSETKLGNYGTAERGNLTIEVMDTPGLSDTDDQDLEHAAEIKKSLFSMQPGPHALLLVVKCCDRFTPEDLRVYNALKKIFGEHLPLYTIVVFTGVETIEGGKKIFKQQLPQNKMLSFIVNEASRRYIFFHNKSRNPAKKEKDVTRLIKKVKKLIMHNSTHYFQHTFSQVLDPHLQLMTEEEMILFKVQAIKRRVTLESANDSVARNTDPSELARPSDHLRESSDNGNNSSSTDHLRESSDNGNNSSSTDNLRESSDNGNNSSSTDHLRESSDNGNNSSSTDNLRESSDNGNNSSSTDHLRESSDNGNNSSSTDLDNQIMGPDGPSILSGDLNQAHAVKTRTYSDEDTLSATSQDSIAATPPDSIASTPPDIIASTPPDIIASTPPDIIAAIHLLSPLKYSPSQKFKPVRRPDFYRNTLISAEEARHVQTTNKDTATDDIKGYEDTTLSTTVDNQTACGVHTNQDKIIDEDQAADNGQTSSDKTKDSDMTARDVHTNQDKNIIGEDQATDNGQTSSDKTKYNDMTANNIKIGNAKSLNIYSDSDQRRLRSSIRVKDKIVNRPDDLTEVQREEYVRSLSDLEDRIVEGLIEAEVKNTKQCSLM